MVKSTIQAFIAAINAAAPTMMYADSIAAISKHTNTTSFTVADLDSILEGASRAYDQTTSYTFDLGQLHLTYGTLQAAVGALKDQLLAPAVTPASQELLPTAAPTTAEATLLDEDSFNSLMDLLLGNNARVGACCTGCVCYRAGC